MSIEDSETIDAICFLFGCQDKGKIFDRLKEIHDITWSGVNEEKLLEDLINDLRAWYLRCDF